MIEVLNIKQWVLSEHAQFVLSHGGNAIRIWDRCCFRIGDRVIHKNHVNSPNTNAWIITSFCDDQINILLNDSVCVRINNMKHARA